MRLDVFKNNAEGWGFLTEVSDNSARSANNLLGSTIFIELGQTAPFTDILTAVNHDEVNTTFLAKSLDEAFVFLVVAVICKAAKTSSTSIKSLGRPEEKKSVNN